MIRPLRSFALVVLAVALLGTGAAPAQAAPAAGRYIVTLKGGVRPAAVVAARGLRSAAVFDRALNGFAADLTSAQLAALQRSPEVAAIEADLPITAQATQPVSGGQWGLDRIDQHNLPLSGSYTYLHTGANVNAYIIDTGIQISHPDFGGNASVAFDATGGDGLDCNGHGTFIAGLVGGSTYGVLKQAKLYSVRVMNCAGSATVSQIIAGVSWVAANHQPRAVATLAIGGASSAALNSAVTALVNSGVFVAVPAGGESGNACNSSPANVAVAYTVASSDKTDHVASFSNYGTCVDAYAPGVSVTSDWIGGGSATLSGSVSVAFAAGIAGLYKATYGEASSATVTSWINTNATYNVLIGVPPGTANRLLYTGGL